MSHSYAISLHNATAHYRMLCPAAGESTMPNQTEVSTNNGKQYVGRAVRYRAEAVTGLSRRSITGNRLARPL